jgi:hypothetical protein
MTLFFYCALAVVYISEITPADTCVVNSRDFYLPIYYSEEGKSRIDKMHLFVSTTRGRTWQKVSTATPDQTKLKYSARSDGTYWFALQIVEKDGNMDPSDTSKLKPYPKVRVQTRKTLRELAKDFNSRIEVGLRASFAYAEKLADSAQRLLQER